MVLPGLRQAPPTPTTYRVLGSYEQKIARAMSMAIFPKGGPLSPSGEDTGVSYFFDSYLADVPSEIRLGLRAFLFIFEFLPILFIFKLSRFTTLDDADKEKYFDVWQNHRIFWLRAALLGVKSVFCLQYYADEKVREEIGFYITCDGKSGKHSRA